MIKRVFAVLWATATALCAQTIGYHEVKTDSSGAIAAWTSYDNVIRQVWKFWKSGMAPCPNGVPYYLQHQVWKPEHDARGLGGDQIPMALSSWNLLYGYLADKDLHRNMTLMAGYWLTHGMTKDTDLWPHLPYPYNTDIHSGIYDGDMRAGKGYLQPDKAASFGAELIVLYKITGEQRYLSAAKRIADTLAARVKAGDAEHSPWPYRVNAVTGEVHQDQTKEGKPVSASYTTNYTGALRLFSELTALKQGNYTRAFNLVSAWLKRYPMKNNKWGPFFEDVRTRDYSDTEINADTLAMYIVEHPGWAPLGEAKKILDWSFNTFQNHEYDQWKVVPINEQTVYKVPGNSHTSRHSSVELSYCEKTSDCATKADAIRRLNWATYTVAEDGKNRYIRDDIWLTDGYGDYVRHYLRSMAAASELAPDDQNHLLRTSSVIQEIKYSDDRITYKKFDAQSREVFKLGAWVPKKVEHGTMVWDAQNKTVRIRSSAREVTIVR